MDLVINAITSADRPQVRAIYEEGIGGRAIFEQGLWPNKPGMTP